MIYVISFSLSTFTDAPLPICHGTKESCASSRSSLPQHLMDERHGDRAFTDGGRHTFDVAAADVTDREDAGTARFEEVWRTRERPVRGLEIFV